MLRFLRGNNSVRGANPLYVRELRRLDAELKVIRGQIALKIKESIDGARGVGPVLAAKILERLGTSTHPIQGRLRHAQWERAVARVVVDSIGEAIDS